MTEEKESKPIEERQILYTDIPESVLISMDTIIDCYYEEARKDYKACKGDTQKSVNHVFPHLERVLIFLEELGIPDRRSGLLKYKDVDETGAGSSVEK